MSDHSRHDLDELSEYLDGRLPDEGRRALEERLRLCSECQAAVASLRWVKAQARKLAGAEAPAGLDAMVRAALRPPTGGEAASSATPSRASRWRHHLPALAAAAVVVLGLALVLSRLDPPPADSLPEAIAEDVRARAAGRLQLAVEGSDAARLEAFFARQRLGFETRVLDLGMMGYGLQGGSAGPLAARPSALMVYRENATGLEVLCRMLREGFAALPAPHQAREHDGIPFHVYRLGDVTVVFWPEGPVLCALAGRGAPEGLVQLAFGKAMKASRPD